MRPWRLSPWVRRNFKRGNHADSPILPTKFRPRHGRRGRIASVARARAVRQRRGAADVLNVVVPHGEKAYYDLRPTIAIPRPTGDGGKKDDAAIDLDGFFGLHPALGPLKPLYDQRHLAIVDAVGSPDPTRSHFDAQDYMESGTPGRKATEDGWMNRALPQAAGKVSPLRAVSLGPV